MATRLQVIANLSQELLDELTDGGTRDLSQVPLSQIEQEVYEAADRVTQRVIQGMLEDQAEQVDVDRCPTCNTPLQERPPNETPMTLQRCEVQWAQPVKRCRKCRRDFFPSGGHDGMRGGSDMQPGGDA